jgi:hypothetical protein
MAPVIVIGTLNVFPTLTVTNGSAEIAATPLASMNAGVEIRNDASATANMNARFSMVITFSLFTVTAEILDDILKINRRVHCLFVDREMLVPTIIFIFPPQRPRAGGSAPCTPSQSPNH